MSLCSQAADIISDVVTEAMTTSEMRCCMASLQFADIPSDVVIEAITLTLTLTSDVSIYKCDFDIDFDYFHVTKFDSDFFLILACVVTQRGCFHLINLLRHIFRQLTVSSVSYSSRNTLIQSLT
jgi:hypothetical protein